MADQTEIGDQEGRKGGERQPANDLVLPEGVTRSDWKLEKTYIQNARIRALLGAIRLLEEARESELTILHCSPDRLRDIWGDVARVGALIHDEIAPFLLLPSKIPRLEEARKRAVEALDALSEEILAELVEVDRGETERSTADLRRRLSLSIGRLHHFLQEAFADMMAADPRSRADPDYFLSKRFPRDVEEAERLYLAVEQLERYLETLEVERKETLLPLLEWLERERVIPRGASWDALERFLEALDSVLVSKLWELITMGGIRYYETQILDHYAAQIPSEARTIVTLHSVAWWTLDQIQGVQALSESARAVESTLAAELANDIRALDLQLRNLIQYVPGWLSALASRRALLVRKAELPS